jgi:Zn-finger nucleic acid-binding protein
MRKYRLNSKEYQSKAAFWPDLKRPPDGGMMQLASVHSRQNPDGCQILAPNSRTMMRLLVQCPNCRRQFDASGREIGSHFECPCGTTVEVQQPESHEAAVVRCSSCGAPRAEHAKHCSFCGSDFTLREQDLDSVCPNCLARVSDQAQFCHHCGAGLVPEAVTGQATELECPACREQHTLTSRRMGKVAALECGRCAGLWLGNEVFRQLTLRASQEAERRDAQFMRQRKRSAGALSVEPQRYRPCIVCHQLMNRRNYGFASGAIIDFCREHGIWFDADELPRILEFIQAGGLSQTQLIRSMIGDSADTSPPVDLLDPRPHKPHASTVPLLHQPSGIIETIVEWLRKNWITD